MLRIRTRFKTINGYHYVLLLILNVWAISICAITPERIVFVNTGRMTIDVQPVSGVSIYIPNDIRCLTDNYDSVKVILNGVIELGGNFYQDANTPVFGVSGSTNKTSSAGTLRFVSDNGWKRYITTSNDITAFDRSTCAVAFPNLELNTNDSLILHPKMGIDASSLHRVHTKKGIVILQSDQIGDKVYNASLRFPMSGTSESLVDEGSVMVEQHVKTYRYGTQLFAFATPFKATQLSGYFAGNWVRRPIADGVYGHTTYVLGNKTSSTNASLIDLNQYIIDPLEKLKTAQAYLIKPRLSGFPYASLQTTNGLSVTGASASVYDKDKFEFNGSVYTLPSYQEQIFADDVLFSKTIPQGTYIASTINWLIGNSYTSPISTKLLAQEMENSGLKFSPIIYVFPAGSTSYQPYDISGTGDGISVTNLTEIPSMSIFMLRLSKGQTIGSKNTFTIGKNQLHHGNISHGSAQQIKALRTNASRANQVIFRLSPAENSSVYDLAAIGIRDSASLGSDKYDIAKVVNPGNEGFQLYTLSQSGAKLSANGIPTTENNVTLALKPASNGGLYQLTVSGQETLTTTGLWLEDCMNGQQVDLMSNSNYSFETTPSDIPNRFLVHFNKQVITGHLQPSSPTTTFSRGKLNIRNLTPEDLQSTLYIYDTLGKQVMSAKVESYPNFSVHVNVSAGVYIAQLKGTRNILFKFIN